MNEKGGKEGLERGYLYGADCVRREAKQGTRGDVSKISVC